VVDPIIGNARFSKVLMDGGSSLKILYVHTLRLMGIGLDQLEAVPRHRARQAGPSPRADRPAGLVRHREEFPQGDPHLRGGGVQGSLPRYTWAATPNSWRSPTILT
jgi:hypothetical protein